MKIALNTLYTIGDTVRIPNAHTTVDVQITDVCVQVNNRLTRGPEVTYLTDNPDFQSVMETAIIEFVAPPEQPIAEPPKSRNHHPMFANKPF